MPKVAKPKTITVDREAVVNVFTPVGVVRVDMTEYFGTFGTVEMPSGWELVPMNGRTTYAIRRTAHK